MPGSAGGIWGIRDQLLKGVPAPREPGSAERGSDADSANTAMFYGEIKMEEAPGIFK